MGWVGIKKELSVFFPLHFGVLFGTSVIMLIIYNFDEMYNAEMNFLDQLQ